MKPQLAAGTLVPTKALVPHSAIDQRFFDGTALTPIREAELELAAAKAAGKIYTLGKERLAEIDDMARDLAKGLREAASARDVAAVELFLKYLGMSLGTFLFCDDARSRFRRVSAAVATDIIPKSPPAVPGIPSD